MAPVAANAYRGKLQFYFEQARDGAPEIMCALLVATGNPSDDAIADFTTMTALLASSADEATFTNYVRKNVTTITVSINNTLNTVAGSSDLTVTWGSAGGALNNTLARACFYYDPAPGSSTDTTRLPLFYHDISTTTDGTTLVLTVNAAGLWVI